jgi:hypothetical protein
MRLRAQGIPLVAVAVALLTGGALATPDSTLAAELVGGREQAAISRVFLANPAHKRQLVVSIRASTVSPSWTVVKSVRPEGGGRTSAHFTPIKLISTFYHRVKGAERVKRPPAAVRSDLARNFRVAIVYTGSGGESIAYKQLSRSVCAGSGGFTDQQDSIISPMSWSVRYIVNLDDLVAAVESSQGAMIVPSISFDALHSSLSAVQSLTRTIVDAGCGGTPSTFQCTTSYRLSGSAADELLSFLPGLGTEIGIPTRGSTVGDCDPDDYTLGPSLWDSGATTALVTQLDLIGGELPGNPYAPVTVSWPTDSAALSDGSLASPCQGDAAACSDRFHWTGTIALAPLPGD